MANASEVSPVRRRTIGCHAAFAINLVLFTAVGAFLALDYFREVDQRVMEKITGLDDEALTLHQAIGPLGPTSGDRAQSLVDQVCARMSDEFSPGHHLVVETGGRVVQSRAHRRNSPEVVRAIREAAAAPSRRSTHEGANLVVGVHQEAGVNVYVAERLENIHAEVRQQIVYRSVAVILFGMVLAAAVNLVIQKVVVRPIRRLVYAIDAIRAGKLGTQAGRFASHELDRLSLAVNEMSQALAENASRRRAVLAKARRVQENLLPRAGKAPPGVGMAAIHRPAEDVAGDFYDLIVLPDGTMLCAVADVVGHGVPAAMMAAMLKVLLLDAAEVDPDPGRAVSRINRRFGAVALPEDFASLLLVRWQPDRQILSYASAGHEPALLVVGPGTPTTMTATGPLVGIAEGDLWETGSIEVSSGAVLVCLTDGVTEAMDPGGKQFGRERLAKLVGGVGRASAEQILADLDAAVQLHQNGRAASDDCTLVVLRLDAAPID